MASLNKTASQIIVTYYWKGARLQDAFPHADEEAATARKSFIEYELKKAKRTGTTPGFIKAKVQSLKDKRRTKLLKQSGGVPTAAIDAENEILSFIRANSPTPATNPTADAFYEAFEKYVAPDVAFTTKYNYRNSFDSLRELAPFTYLEEVTPSLLQEYKKKALEKGHTATTINLRLMCLSRIFRWGAEQGMITVNPVRAVKRFKVEDNPKPYLTLEEIDVLIAGAKEHSRDLHCFCALGVYAGLRLNEIVNSRWEWITPIEKLVDVAGRVEFFNGPGKEAREELILRAANFIREHPDLSAEDIAQILSFSDNIPSGGDMWTVFDFDATITVRNGFQFRTKNKLARSIPLHLRLRELLAEYAEPEGYIMKPKKLKWPKNYLRWQPSVAFINLLKRIGLRQVNRYGQDEFVTPHVLRHTFASMLAQHGRSPYDIMKWCGHSNIKISEGYMHLAPQKERLTW